MRWRHPTRGIVPPDEFIPVAEESGLIVPLSDLVMRQALKQIAEWWRQGCRDLRVAVNVSGAQFEAPGFPDWVFAHLDEAGLPGACLELEITESLLMVDEAAAALAVRAVRELGVHVAIDDFGTGYSSLAYLKHFPIEALKIDRSFVADLGPRLQRRRHLRGHHRHGPPARAQDRRRGRRDPGTTRSSWPRMAARWRRASTSPGRWKRRRWPSYCASARTNPAPCSWSLPAKKGGRRAAGGLRSRAADQGEPRQARQGILLSAGCITGASTPRCRRQPAGHGLRAGLVDAEDRALRIVRGLSALRRRLASCTSAGRTRTASQSHRFPMQR